MGSQNGLTTTAIWEQCPAHLFGTKRRCPTSNPLPADHCLSIQMTRPRRISSCCRCSAMSPLSRGRCVPEQGLFSCRLKKRSRRERPSLCILECPNIWNALNIFRGLMTLQTDPLLVENSISSRGKTLPNNWLIPTVRNLLVDTYQLPFAISSPWMHGLTTPPQEAANSYVGIHKSFSYMNWSYSPNS